MIRTLIAAIVLALFLAGCATDGDNTDWWQKGGDPSSKRGPMRGSGGPM